MARPRFIGPFPCCRHCRPADDWHVTHGPGAHGDACPGGCSSAQAAGGVHFSRGGAVLVPRCGDPDWAALTAVRGDVSCQTCLNLMAGAGRHLYDVKPCPSEAAYRRELRHGGPVHERCRLAANREAADRKARRRRARQELAA